MLPCVSETDFVDENSFEFCKKKLFDRCIISSHNPSRSRHPSIYIQFIGSVMHFSVRCERIVSMGNNENIYVYKYLDF